MATILPGDRIVSIESVGGEGGNTRAEGGDSGRPFTRVVQQTLPDGRVLSVAIDVLSPFCGEGVVQRDQGEECDDGNESDTDSCRNSCLLPRCGDGVLSDEERCEDGNTISGDGCSDRCVPDTPDRVEGVVIDLPVSPLAGAVNGGKGVGVEGVTGTPDDPRVRRAATSHAPAGETGPAAVGVMAAGAAAGWAWVRRRRVAR